MSKILQQEKGSEERIGSESIEELMDEIIRTIYITH